MTDKMTPAQEAGLEVGDVVETLSSGGKDEHEYSKGEKFVFVHDDRTDMPRFKRLFSRDGYADERFLPLKNVRKVRRTNAIPDASADEGSACLPVVVVYKKFGADKKLPESTVSYTRDWDGDVAFSIENQEGILFEDIGDLDWLIKCLEEVRNLHALHEEQTGEKQ